MPHAQAMILYMKHDSDNGPWYAACPGERNGKACAKKVRRRPPAAAALCVLRRV